MIYIVMTGILLILLLFLDSKRTNEFVYNREQSEEQMVDTIQYYIENNVKKIGSKGISISLVNDEKTIMKKEYGVTTPENEQYVLGSVSKSFTALCIMQLVEQDKIKLDKSIGEYLKEDKKYNERMELITVRELLNHTSGIGVNALTINKKIQMKQDGFKYSNLNYNLLGKIIEKVSGLPYSDYVEKNIFEPLKMQYSVANLSMANTKGYQNYFGFIIKKQNNKKNRYRWIKEPSGYLVSTLNDMILYMQMYLNGGILQGKSIINEESLNKIFSFEVDATNDEVSGGMLSGKAYYNMGWICKNANGEKIYYHSGKVKNFNSMMVLFPKRNYGLGILSNTGDFLVGTNLFEKMSEGIVKIILGKSVQNISPIRFKVSHILLDWVMIVVTSLFLMNLTNIYEYGYGLMGSNLFFNLILYILIVGVYISFLFSKKISLCEILDFVPSIWWLININCFIMIVSCILIVMKYIGCF